MPEQPSGTVTLVFTDIEGSTRLLHDLGQDAYREALAKHHRIVRDAFGRHDGYEALCEGDSFFYAFPSPREALGAVEEAMDGLEPGPIRIRVGIHTGEPGLDPPTYLGMDVHVAARVMAVGTGGQVLLTRATRDLIDAELLDLGEHRLKDITDPVWLYQLGAEEFPPLRSLNNTNLPTPASSFLGREAELDEAAPLLAGCRLLTVSGPGGTGKTRFAIELASRQLPRFPNGVFWVPLAALRDPDLVVSTIGQSIGSKNGVVEHIGERRMLLVLDNFEQVVSSAPELPELLTRCPGLSLLVTSRELLRVQGEVEFPLPPLGLAEAVELFCARARCRPDHAAEELCRRLEGLPLAVELAAARMSVFAPEQLLQRLGRRLDLLQGGRDADPRQQTLRATIRWSYDLLDEEDARRFRRLAVFAGGCTLEAAEEVAAAGPNALQGLVEKSLLRHTDRRFWMLETIREFALDELEANGELATARAEYSGWMARLAEQAGARLHGHDQTELLARLREEHGNIREVVTLCLAARDAELALQILVDLDRYWFVRPSEAMEWFERGLELLDQVPPLLAGHALRVAGTTAWFQGRPELTLSRCRESLAVFEALGDERGISLVYTRLAPPVIDVEGNVDEAVQLLERAIAMHRRLGQRHELAIALNVLGGIGFETGDLVRGAELMEESIALSREVGDSLLVANGLGNLAEMRFLRGDLERAGDDARQSLRMSWAHRQLSFAVQALAVLALVARDEGDTRRSAMLWGAVQRLRSEPEAGSGIIVADQFRDKLGEVLADAEGISAGEALTTAEAVEFALSE